MTIDEAIAHAREVALEQRRRSGTCTTNDNECDKFSNCMKCAEEHEQIADWLEELKIYRESSYGELHDMIYNKAIDDVMNKAKEIQEEQIKNLEQHPKRSGKQWAIYMNTHLGHIQVACKRIIEEQLKAGGENAEVDD